MNAEVLGTVVSGGYGNLQLLLVAGLGNVGADVVRHSMATTPVALVHIAIAELVSQIGVAQVFPLIDSSVLVCRIEQRATILSGINQRGPALLTDIVGTGLPVGILEG